MRILKIKYAILSLILVIISSCNNSSIEREERAVNIKFNNGSIFCTGTLSVNKKTGVPENRVGLWTFYYPNGKVEYLIEYNTNGEMTNKKLYDENGILIFSEITTDNVTTSTTFFDNGRIETELISKEVIDGEIKTLYETEKTYYLNGQLLYQQSLEDGILEGTSTTYDSNGVLVLKIEYKNGFFINK